MAELGNFSCFLIVAALAAAGLFALFRAGRSRGLRPLAHVVAKLSDGLGLGRAAGRALIGLDARFAAGRRRRYCAVVPGVITGRGDLPRFLVGAAGALAGAGLLALRAAGRGLRHRPRAHVVAELGDGLGLGLGAAGLGTLIHRGAVRIARRRRGRFDDKVVGMIGNQHLDGSTAADKRDFVQIQIYAFLRCNTDIQHIAGLRVLRYLKNEGRKFSSNRPVFTCSAVLPSHAIRVHRKLPAGLIARKKLRIGCRDQFQIAVIGNSYRKRDDSRVAVEIHIHCYLISRICLPGSNGEAPARRVCVHCYKGAQHRNEHKK